MNKETLKLAQRISHEIWQSHDDKYGYRSGKQKRNAEVDLDDPNCIYFFWGQFDWKNQLQFISKVLQESPSESKDELLQWIFSWIVKE